jgi:RND family efflux transporter MFP subunit
MSEDGNIILGEGTVNFIDNNISATTGTVLVKASVSNPKELLWPGLLVRVKLVLTIEPDAMVVPTQSINVDQQGNFVYVVQLGKAIVKHVTADRQVGNLTVISKGLSAGEEVVIVSPPNLGGGDAVVIRPNLKGTE